MGVLPKPTGPAASLSKIKIGIVLTPEADQKDRQALFVMPEDEIASEPSRRNALTYRSHFDRSTLRYSISPNQIQPTFRSFKTGCAIHVLLRKLHLTRLC